MEPYRAWFRNKYITHIYAILLLISAILAALFAVNNMKISPDSMVYSLVTQEIRSGNGIRLPIIRLMDNHVPVDGTVPYPEEGPLLPLLLSLLGGVTPWDFFAAQLLNFFSHVIISIFTFMIMKKIYANNAIALLTGILVSISFPLLKVTHHIWGETLFIALITAALYFLVLSKDSDRHQLRRNLFIASICASAAILTRFVGVVMIPVFCWAFLVSVINKSKKNKYISIIAAIIPPVIATGVLFFRNYIHSGTIFGWNPPPFERSYLDAFTGTIHMIFLQFSLGERPVVLISAFTILFVFYLIVNASSRRELSNYIHSGLDFIIVFILCYTFLIAVAMAKSQAVFEVRFMAPLVPFLFILCTTVIVFVWGMIRLKGFSQLSLFGIILSLGILTAGNCYKTYLRLEEFSRKQESHYSILNSPTYIWLKENYGRNDIITSNKAYPLSFFGGFSTVTIPHKRFDKNYRVDNLDMVLPDRMAKIGSHILALFDKVEEQYEGIYLTELFNIRKDNDKFVLMHKFSDGVVYQLKE